ncbi:MAG: hypothetical protein XD74_0050 [Actinobacteria bacterium 66_15]|nr:MAG: hypothetical protein XD74_0050 [Actinobacteria bacterium 66_15]
MTAAGVVVDGVAGAEVLGVVLEGEAEPPADHVIELLAGVTREMDRLVLGAGDVGRGHHERLGLLVLEGGRHMAVLEALTALDRQSFARTHHRVAREVRVLARQEFDHVHAEPLGRAVEEGEGEIGLARLHRRVLGHTATGGLGHLLHREVHVLAQCADPARDLGDPRFHAVPPQAVGIPRSRSSR